MNEPERLLSRSPGASSAEHRGEHVGTKKSRTELVQQLADSAPALVAAAEAIDGLQLQRELLKLDPDCNTKMAQAITSALAARGLRPPAPGTPADPQQAEAADIDRFRRHCRPFAEAFAELQHELAGILRTDGVVVDGLHAPSACAILSGRAEAFARVLNAGAVPDRTFGEWGELATLVSCEVAALTRPNSQAPAADAGPRAMPAHRHAELVAQLEAVAPPLLEFAGNAYRRGWAEERPAAGDLDAVRAMLPPFTEAVEQLGPSLHARRRGAWLDLDGWGGTSACGILHGLASSLAREIERGQLPRDRRHLVGEGMSQLLVPAWWDQLRRHVQHELDLLAGRASEPLAAHAAPATGTTLDRASPTILRSGSLAASILVTLAKAGPLNRAQMKALVREHQHQQVYNLVAPKGKLRTLELVAEDDAEMIRLTDKGRTEAAGQTKAGAPPLV